MQTTISHDWYQTFFHGLVVDFWRHCVPPQQTQAEVVFLRSELRLRAGSAVLDMPCGDGRHAVELAAMGCHVTGVDLSPQFLAAAQSRADDRRVGVRLIQHDMASYQPARESLDGAYCLGNSWGYLPDDKTATLLCNVHSALRPGGRFVFDTGVAAELLLPHMEDEVVYEVGEMVMHSQHDYDMSASRMITHYRFTRGDQTQTCSITQRVHTIAEIVALVHAAGLRIVNLYGSLDRAPLRLKESRCLYVVAEK